MKAGTRGFYFISFQFNSMLSLCTQALLRNKINSDGVETCFFLIAIDGFFLFLLRFFSLC